MDGIYSANSRGQLSSDEILAALQSLLASEALRLSERNRRFLSFVVRRAVDGQADRIKAYSIGVDVFGRDDSFDPTLDPIVRIEATRLRSALTAYYEGPGRVAAVMITIPKGSYVPNFSRRSDLTELDQPAQCEPEVSCAPVTIVIQDRSGPTDSETALRRELFTDALLVALQEAGIRVRMTPTREHSAAAEAIEALFSDPGTACSLDIAVRSLDGRRRFSWRLIDLRSSEVLASQVREIIARETPCVDLIDDIALSAAAIIAPMLHRRPASAS